MKTGASLTSIALICSLLSACSTPSDQTVSRTRLEPVATIENTDAESPKGKRVKRLNFEDDVTTLEEVVVGAAGAILTIGVCAASYGILCPL
jgi:hypothetical protein